MVISKKQKIYQVIIHIVLILMALFMVMPFILLFLCPPLSGGVEYAGV